MEGWSGALGQLSSLLVQCSLGTSPGSSVMCLGALSSLLTSVSLDHFPPVSLDLTEVSRI